MSSETFAVIAQITIKSGGEYLPPGSVIEIETLEEAEKLVERGHAEWATGAPDPADESNLPEDFPHRDTLAAAGVWELEDVPKTEEDLVALPGVGEGRAADILSALDVG